MKDKDEEFTSVCIKRGYMERVKEMSRRYHLSDRSMLEFLIDTASRQEEIYRDLLMGVNALDKYRTERQKKRLKRGEEKL